MILPYQIREGGEAKVYVEQGTVLVLITGSKVEQGWRGGFGCRL